MKKNKLQVARKFKNIYRKENREVLRFKPSLADYARQTLTEIAEKVIMNSASFLNFFNGMVFRGPLEQISRANSGLGITALDLQNSNFLSGQFFCDI